MSAYPMMVVWASLMLWLISDARWKQIAMLARIVDLIHEMCNRYYIYHRYIQYLLYMVGLSDGIYVLWLVGLFI